MMIGALFILVLLGFIYIQAYCIRELYIRYKARKEQANEQIKDTYSL